MGGRTDLRWGAGLVWLDGELDWGGWMGELDWGGWMGEPDCSGWMGELDGCGWMGEPDLNPILCGRLGRGDFITRSHSR